MITKAGYLYINFRRKLSDYKIKQFFAAIEKIVSRYLKVYIIKPNVLVESEDVGFKNIGLYNVKDSMLNSLSFEERVGLYNKIKIESRDNLKDLLDLIDERIAAPDWNSEKILRYHTTGEDL